jgi:hypothetical protein
MAEQNFYLAIGLMVITMGPQVFKLLGTNPKIPGTIRVTLSKFHTEDPQFWGDL